MVKSVILPPKSFSLSLKISIKNLVEDLPPNLRIKILEIKNPARFFRGEIAKKLGQLLQEFSVFKNYAEFFPDLNVAEEIAQIKNEIQNLISRYNLKSINTLKNLKVAERGGFEPPVPEDTTP